MSAADQNLAEMAQRLEAALRRPGRRSTVGAAGGARTARLPRAAAQRATDRPAGHRAPAKSGFENLEDEMASLLGRPKNPS